MVVLSEYGCSTEVFEQVPNGCAASRGTLFDHKKSSTWKEVGTYGINGDGVGLEANLGYSLAVNFASETLGIGLNGPTLDNQTMGGFVAPSPFYLGVFGLNDQPVNFSTVGNSTSPSFLTTLKDKGVIPSLSWSYTAGAKYRLKGVHGQLIFSGYDTSRFTENSVSFTMADDVTRDLVVSLQSIQYSGATQTTLLSDPIFVMIDSTDPNLWLPESVCQAFEQAFGLTLDAASGMYLVNESHHSELVKAAAEVSFRISNVKEGGNDVTITLPYSAFNLTAEYPLVPTTSFYFPLKRAANATQFTLGRTFLQEAYITADYERGVFNVSACKWIEGADKNIVTIQPKDGGNAGGADPNSPSSHTLSSGAIAGIVIGCCAIAAAAGAVLVFVFLRRRKAARFKAKDPEPDVDVINGPVFNAGYPSPFGTEPTLPSHEESQVSGSQGTPESGLASGFVAKGPTSVTELDGDETQLKPTTELDGTEVQRDSQAGSVTPVYELGGEEIEKPRSS